jgi:transketolase N-terminal domain/subunit
LIIAIVAILTPSLPESKFSVLLNLATGSMATGLGGAAGVAQNSKSGNTKVEVENIENVENSEDYK